MQTYQIYADGSDTMRTVEARDRYHALDQAKDVLAESEREAMGFAVEVFGSDGNTSSWLSINERAEQVMRRSDMREIGRIRDRVYTLEGHPKSGETWVAESLGSGASMARAVGPLHYSDVPATAEEAQDLLDNQVDQDQLTTDAHWLQKELEDNLA